MADSKGSAEALSGSSEDREPAKGASSSKSVKEPRRRFGNPITRLVRFFREVVAELRKVIYPTRQELLTYTGVVVVFVVIMVTVVFGLDWVFHKGVLLVFGDPNAK